MWTRKVLGVTVAFWTFLAALGALGLAASAAAGPLEGKIVVSQGTCEFDEKGQMLYDGPVRKPCQMAVDPNDQAALYFIVIDKGEPQELIRYDIEKERGESLWAKGRHPV